MDAEVSRVRALVVDPDGAAEIRRVDATAEAIGAVVGGGLEAVIGSNWHLYRDRDGFARDRPVNEAAARIVALLQQPAAQEVAAQEVAAAAVDGLLPGTVVFLGNGDGGAEADVPTHVLGAAMTLQQDGIIRRPQVPLTPYAGEQGQRIFRIAATVRKRVLERWAPDSAILSSRVGGAVFRGLGYEVRTLPCLVAIHSALSARTGGERGHSIGVLGQRAADPGMWDGHLVLLVDDRWIVDISADQFDRPAQHLPVPGPMVWEIPGGLDVGDLLWAPGLVLKGERGDGGFVQYQTTTDQSWRDSPDWAGGKHEAAADAARQALQWVRADDAIDARVRGIEKAGSRQPMACKICRQGLHYVVLPDGSQAFGHTRPEDLTKPHDPDPTPVNGLADFDARCDFCQDPHPVWLYTGPNLSDVTEVNPFTGEPMQAGDDLEHGTMRQGDTWACCTICDRYVRANDLPGLWASVLKSKENRKFPLPPHGLARAKQMQLEQWRRYVPHVTDRRPIDAPPPTPIGPRTLPKARNRLVRLLHTEGFEAFGRAAKWHMPGPDVGHPDEIAMLVTVVTPEQGRAHTARIIDSLEQATLYHVSTQFTALALSSGTELADLSVTPEELPAPHGLLVWETPISALPNTAGWGADQVEIIAASWSTVSDLGVWVQWYAHREQFAEGRPVLEGAGVFLPWKNAAGLQFGMAYPTTDLAHDTNVALGFGMFRTLLATWFLILQPGVADVEAQSTNDKQLAKAARRAQLPVPEVRVITLRKARPRQGQSVQGGGWHVGVRFLVRGHWKRQAYGAGRKLRKTIYVAPFLKGPEDAPLKTGGDVPVVKVLR